MEWRLSSVVCLVAVCLEYLHERLDGFEVAIETSTVKQREALIFIDYEVGGLCRVLTEECYRWQK